MSVDVQVSSRESLNLESPVGRPCYVPERRAVGVVVAVEAAGTLAVALRSGRRVPVPAGVGVVLPQVGEFVEVPRDGGLLRGYWLGRGRPRVVDDGRSRAGARRLLVHERPRPGLGHAQDDQTFREWVDAPGCLAFSATARGAAPRRSGRC